MFKRVLLLIRLLYKRQIKKIFFSILLVSIPFFAYALRLSLTSSPKVITVGICTEDKGKYSKSVVDSLLNSSSIDVKLYSRPSLMKDDVRAKKIECGYLLNKHFTSNLSSGKLNGMATVYIAPDSYIHFLTNEIIYSEIFKLYVHDELIQFIQDKSYIDLNDDKIKELTNLYHKYLASNETFSFEFIDSNSNNILNLDSVILNSDNTLDDNNSFSLSEFSLSSLNGIAALLVMFGSIIGVATLYRDKKNKVFYAILGHYQIFCEISDVFVTTSITAVSAYLSLLFSRQISNPLLSFFEILCYSVLCSIYFYVLHRILKKQFIFMASVPILIIACMIICPVFVDFSEFIPVFKIIRLLLPPTYYL